MPAAGHLLRLSSEAEGVSVSVKTIKVLFYSALGAAAWLISVIAKTMTAAIEALVDVVVAILALVMLVVIAMLVLACFNEMGRLATNGEALGYVFLEGVLLLGLVAIVVYLYGMIVAFVGQIVAMAAGVIVAAVVAATSGVASVADSIFSANLNKIRSIAEKS